MENKNEFMPPSNEEIIEILEIVNESEYDELRLEIDGVKMIFSKNSIDLPEQQSEREPIPIGSSQAAKPEIAVAAENTAEKAETMQEAPIDEEGLVPIKTPLLGIFYRAPKPGAPNFVEVGAFITEDDTVCLIEVMKLFNTVKAGVKGRIVKICAENNKMVEFNQTLFLIDTEANSEVDSKA